MGICLKSRGLTPCLNTVPAGIGPVLFLAERHHMQRPDMDVLYKAYR